MDDQSQPRATISGRLYGLWRAQSPSRRTTMPASTPPTYVYIITLMTFAYLIVELSFNARLLDVTGGDTTPDVVQSTEYWGRGISGAAATLAVWGMWLMPAAERHRWPLTKTIMRMLFAAMICGTAMWQLQSSIINHFVNQSTGNDRRIAAKLKTIERSAIDNRVEISGIPLTPEVITSPEGKSFLALLPFMANSIDGIEEKIDPGLQASIRDRVIHKIGDPRDFHDTVFEESVKTIANEYDHYVDACNSFYSATNASQAEVAYDNLVQKQFGQVLPKGLSFESFEALPEIQNQWHTVLKLSNNTMLDSQLTDEPFLAAVYNPIVDSEVAQQMTGLNGAGSEYEDGGEKETAGRNAMTALIVPPIALAFSIAGALLHIFKSTNYIAGLLFPWVNIGRGKLQGNALARPIEAPTEAIAVIVIGIALAAFLFPNKVTSSPLYSFFDEHVVQTYGLFPAWICRWIIQAQPFFWPFNEYIRTHILGGFSF